MTRPVQGTLIDVSTVAKEKLQLQATERKIDHLAAKQLASDVEICFNLPVGLELNNNPRIEEPPN